MFEVGSLTGGSLNGGFGPIDLGLGSTADASKSCIKAGTIKAKKIHIQNHNINDIKIFLKEGVTNLINDISGTNIELVDASFTMIDSTYPTDRTKDRGIRVDASGELQYQSNTPNLWYNVDYNIKNIIDALTTLSGPSSPIIESVVESPPTAEHENGTFVVTFLKPMYNNYLKGDKNVSSTPIGYKIELSIDSNFDTPSPLSTILSSSSAESVRWEKEWLAPASFNTGFAGTKYYLRISAKSSTTGRYGIPVIYPDT